jgi:hypothetical protein
MNRLGIITTTVAGSGVIALAGIGVASAATSNTNVGTSGIPKTIYRQERLDAVADVLDTTTTNVQAAHKDKTFTTLVSKAGLTKETFAAKVKAELTTDLEAKGYSQDQITIAMQHRHIVHEHNMTRKDAKS